MEAVPPLKTKTLKAFAIIAALVFVGMWIGNVVTEWIPLDLGDPTLETIVGWVILMVPVFLLLRTKMARKALAD